MVPRTVLFDVDGTLLDTRDFVFAGFEHALASIGAPVPARVELATRIGPPLEQIYADLVEAARAHELTALHRSFQRENLHRVVAFDGACDVLRQLAQRGLRLAAVTSRSRLTSVASLERVGMLALLETVVSAEDAPALKPDPRHLCVALDALGVSTEGVTMVGDTPADIEAGRRLGAGTVGALYGFHGDALLACEPDASIRDIRELLDVVRV